MKKKTKLWMCIVAVICFMSMGLSVFADAPEHQCCFTYTDTKSLGKITAETHQHIVGYKYGEAQTKPCTILVDRYVDIYTCGCNAIERHYYGITIHNY